MSAPNLHAAGLDDRSLYLRHLIVDSLEGGGRGHVGSALSLVEILRVLYDDVARIRPHEPWWADRDRCILSKGHGCLALYAVLADKGFFPLDELVRQCRAGALLGGHPERGIAGVEVSTGALGHGFSLGVGMAIALRLQGRSSRVFVVTGDGELNEGSIWEAALSAAKHQLSSLTVIVDYNKMQSYARTSEVLELEPLADKWRAFGFGVREVDGHNLAELRTAFADLPFETTRPNVIIAHTIKGRGIDFAEGDAAWHHKAKVDDAAVARMREALERN